MFTVGTIFWHRLVWDWWNRELIPQFYSRTFRPQSLGGNWKTTVNSPVVVNGNKKICRRFFVTFLRRCEMFLTSTTENVLWKMNRRILYLVLRWKCRVQTRGYLLCAGPFAFDPKKWRRHGGISRPIGVNLCGTTFVQAFTVILNRMQFCSPTEVHEPFFSVLISFRSFFIFIIFLFFSSFFHLVSFFNFVWRPWSTDENAISVLQHDFSLYFLIFCSPWKANCFIKKSRKSALKKGFEMELTAFQLKFAQFDIEVHFFVW